MNVTVHPQHPRSPNSESITSTASAALGDGAGGVYLFAADAAMSTNDPATHTVWLSFGTDPATPVAATDTWPIFVRGEPQKFVLPRGTYFKGITSTNATTLIWARVSDE